MVFTACLHIGSAGLAVGAGTGTADPRWLAGYAIPFALVSIVCGRIGPAAAGRRVFGVGVGGFLLGSVLVVTAHHEPALLAVRVLQGFSAGLLLPRARRVLQFDEPPRSRLGPNGALLVAAVTGASSGLPSSRLLAGSGSAEIGRWVSGSAVVVTLAALVVVAAVDCGRHDAGPGRPLRAPAAVALTILVLGCGLLPATRAVSLPPELVTVVVAVPPIVVFGLVGRCLGWSDRAPSIRGLVLCRRAELAASTALALLGAQVSAFLVLMQGYLDDAQANAVPPELVLLCLPIATGIAARLASEWTHAWGRRTAVTAAVVSAVGVIGTLSLIDPASSGADPRSVDVVPTVLLVGVGSGIAATTLLGVVLRCCRRDRTPLLRPTVVVGAVTALPLATAVFVGLSSRWAGPPDGGPGAAGDQPLPAVAGSVAGALWGHAVVLVMICGLSFLLPVRVDAVGREDPRTVDHPVTGDARTSTPA